MRKSIFIKFISVIFLLTTYFLIFSGCGREDEVKPIVDYRCKVTSTITGEKIFVNIPTKVDLKIEKKDPSNGSYQFSYTIVEGDGDLLINEDILEAKEKLPINLSQFTPKYIPKKLGRHIILFRFENEEYATESVCEVQANELAFAVEADNLPKKLLVDKSFSFDLNLTQKVEGETNEFATQVEIAKGKGYVSIVGDTSSHNNLLTRSGDSLLTRAGTSNKYKIKIGNNKLHYKSIESGENVILFRVQNEHGYTQDLSVPLNIQLPDFKVKITADSIGSVGSINNFLLNIEDSDNFGENTYNITYRNIQNSGKLKINGNEIQVGATLQLQKGDNVCEFIPSSLGKTALEFIVKDKYNTTKKDTASFNAERSFVKINVSDYDSLATIYDTRDISFSVSKKDYSGKYFVDLSQSPIGSASVKINGIDYAGGRIEITNIHNTLVSFIPKATGNLTFALKVYDSYNSESIEYIRFNVSNSSGKINISNYNPAATLFSSTFFNFSINKPNYKGGYRFEIFPVNSIGIPDNNMGTLKINNKAYTGGIATVENANNTTVNFIPSQKGDITLKLKIYDDFGGMMSEDLAYKVSNTDIKISVMDLNRNIILAKESSFTVTASKPFYENKNLSFSITQTPIASGNIKIDGQSYMPGGMLVVKNNVPIKIGFTPSMEGTIELLLKVIDEFGGSTTYPISYQVTNPPIRIDYMNFISASVYKTENSFNFSVNKDNYGDGFRYSIVTNPTNSGEIKIDDIPYLGGVFDLVKPSGTKVSFIPSVTGNVTMSLVITDKTGATSKRDLTYKIENPELQLAIGNIEDDLTLNKKTSFSFSTNKKNYNGKIYYTIDSENCTDIKVGSTTYISGTRSEVPNTQGTQVSFIPTLVGKDTVKLSLKIFDDWGCTAEKELHFSVTNSDLALDITNIENNLFVGRETQFKFTANKPGYTGSLKYEIRTSKSGMGTIKVNGETYISGQHEITAGSTVPVTFTPIKEGDVELKVIICDNWSGEKSKSFTYTIGTTPIVMEISDFVSEAVLNQESVFSLALSKLYYSDGYNYSITTTPAQSGIIKVNDEVYKGGKLPVANPKNTKISFTPSITGNVAIKINASDNIGGEQSKTLNFKVVNNPINIIVSNQEIGLTVNKETNFNFAVQKKDYSGKFKFELITEPVVAGKLKINGIDYTGGQIDVSNINNTRITFNPTIIGDLKIILKVYDEFDGEANKELTFAVTNSQHRIVVSNQEPEIIYNVPTLYNFAVVKENYHGAYKFEILQNPEGGKLKVNGTNYLTGKSDLTTPASTSVEFTSTTAGKNVLTLKIYDELGGVAQENLVFNVTNPELKLEVTNHTPDLLVNSSGTFNFNVSKEKYTGSFKFQIDQSPAGMGTIQLNGKAYDGTKLTLANNSNAITFTPTRTGAVSLNLIVSDDWGMEKKIPVTFSVANTNMTINVTNKELDITLNKPTSLNFAVSKPNYAGTFTAKIIQEPAGSGTVKLNSSIVSSNTPISISASNTIEFIPTRTGAVLLKLIVTDELKGEKEIALNFNVTNPELKLEVTNHTPDLLVNSSGTFNFNVSKEKYTGSFKFQIDQSPAGMGTIQLNGKAYDGTKLTLANNSNAITFTPTRTGAVSLNLIVSDDWGMEKKVPVTFSVSNTNMIVSVTNKELDITLNKSTSLNFAVSKPNYAGTFTAKIIQEPAGSGTVKLNSSVVSSNTYTNISATNSIEFTPTRIGAILLKLIIVDELGGEKEVPLNFNVTNPAIRLNITNKEAQLTYKKATSFNVAISKANYTGNFTYEILQEPAGSGNLTVDNKAYSGGIQNVTNPNNLLVGYTPSTEGYVSLKVVVSDNTGAKTEEVVGFNVVNSPVVLTLNTPERNQTIGQTVNFTMKAFKEGYSNSFNYEVTPLPIDAGTITVSGKSTLTGVLNPNPSTIAFTPTKTGTAILNVKVTDQDGKAAEKQVYFNVGNTPLAISFANAEENVILNNPTTFVFKVAKNNYPDDKAITYTISPAFTGTLVVDGKSYTGTSITIPYSKIKNGINVQYSPDREGSRGLTFSVQDEFNGTTNKSLTFNVANPELQLYLTGVNTEAANEATLGSTYKFYYNINKANYADAFSYWITLDPAEVGIVGTSDATPRNRSARSGGGVQMETGTIQNSPNGLATGEIRFTPSNVNYLNREVKVKVVIRDKWNNEKTAEATFKIVTSAIQLNVNRKTSISVEDPYVFFYTVSKPGYSSGFKYSLVGWAEGDKIEISDDNKKWTTYSGGKFDVPAPDHTYIRYTPAKIGTVPMRLFVYDNLNGEAMQELTFDVKAPEVRISADATVKQGYLNQFVPFTLTANEDKNENVNVGFSVDDPSFNGELKFNNNPVIVANSRIRSTPSNFSVTSGSNNKLEIMSYDKGTWGTTATATNRWKQSATVTTSINVDKKPEYTLSTSTIGKGTITAAPNSPTYESGANVMITATPSPGWKFARWEGDASGANAATNITMSSNKSVVAVFEKTVKVVINRCLINLLEPGIFYETRIILKVYANGVLLQNIDRIIPSTAPAPEVEIAVGNCNELTFVVESLQYDRKYKHVSSMGNKCRGGVYNAPSTPNSGYKDGFTFSYPMIYHRKVEAKPDWGVVGEDKIEDLYQVDVTLGAYIEM